MRTFVSDLSFFYRGWSLTAQCVTVCAVCANMFIDRWWCGRLGGFPDVSVNVFIRWWGGGVQLSAS